MPKRSWRPFRAGSRGCLVDGKVQSPAESNSPPDRNNSVSSKIGQAASPLMTAITALAAIFACIFSGLQSCSLIKELDVQQKTFAFTFRPRLEYSINAGCDFSIKSDSTTGCFNVHIHNVGNLFAENVVTYLDFGPDLARPGQITGNRCNLADSFASAPNLLSGKNSNTEVDVGKYYDMQFFVRYDGDITKVFYPKHPWLTVPVQVPSVVVGCITYRAPNDNISHHLWFHMFVFEKYANGSTSMLKLNSKKIAAARIGLQLVPTEEGGVD